MPLNKHSASEPSLREVVCGPRARLGLVLLAFLVLVSLVGELPSALQAGSHTALAAGALDGSAKGFTAQSASPVYTVGSSTASDIRPWIGNSTCPSCGSGITKTQSFAFNDLPIGQEVSLTVHTYFASGASPFLARITAGSASISKGATHTFLAGESAQTWTIRFVPASAAVTVTLGNWQTSGAQYLYFDSFDITVPQGGATDASATTTLSTATSTPGYDSATSSRSVGTSTAGVVIATSTSPVSAHGATSALKIDGVVVPFVLGSTTNAYLLDASSSVIRAYDTRGVMRWSVPVADATDMTTGFDLDNDGVADVAVVKSVITKTKCGSTTIYNRSLELYSGEDGHLFKALAPLADICFPDLGHSVPRVTTGMLQWGDTPGLIVYTPRYWSQGWFYKGTGPKITSVPFLTPSTASFDAEYPNHVGAPEHPTQGWILNSAPENGIIFGSNYIAFSSERVSVYDTRSYGTSQLLRDYGFKARSDIAGRPYGTIAVDPANDSLLSLINGTPVLSVAEDMAAGKRISDLWGGIERNVIFYNRQSGTLAQRFFSYAHDHNDAAQYEGRIAYLAYPWLPAVGSKNSRVAYNVFNESGDGHWYLHVSKPGATGDYARIKDVFLWDIADLDHDGTLELVTSPVHASAGGYYFPDWQTVVSHWNDASGTLTNIRTIEGVIPFIGNIPRNAHTQNDGSGVGIAGFLHGVMVNGAGASRDLFVQDALGTVSAVPI